MATGFRANELHGIPVINPTFTVKEADIQIALARIREHQGSALFQVKGQVYYWAAVVQEAFRRLDAELRQHP